MNDIQPLGHGSYDDGGLPPELAALDLGAPGPALPDLVLPEIVLPPDEDLDDHARFDRATFLVETKSYTRAAALLEPLAQTNPGNTAVLLLLARAHYHSAALGKAETVLRDLLERAPSDAYAHLLLARTLQRAGRAEEGSVHLRIAEAMGLEA